MSKIKEEKIESKIDTVSNIAQAGAASEVVQRYGSAIKEHYVAYSGKDNETGEQLKKGLKDISKSKVHPDYKDSNLKQQAGFAAEDKYTARQNAEKIINKENTRVHNTDIKGSGDYNTLYDHIITDKNGNVIGQEQMKFVGNSPKAELQKLASPKFQKYFDADATITVPSDYYQGIITEADNSIESFKKQIEHAKAEGNTELEKELEEKIKKYEKIKNSIKDSGITNDEAMEARLHPIISTTKDVIKISHKAGVEQAKYGAAISGSISLVKNLTAVVKGDISADEAACEVVKDTGKGIATSYVTAFTGSAIKGAMQNSSKEAIRNLSRTNLAATLVTVVVESSKSFGKYINGEIDGVECLEELGEKGTGLLSSAMYAIAGQVLIPIPVIGGMLGSMIGYSLGSSCYNELLKALKQAKISHAERQRIEKECLKLRSLIIQYRSEMEKYISEYLIDYITTFNDAFDKMNSAIGLNNIDDFISGANSITEKLNGNVKFTNYNEFESLMNSDSVLKI